MLPGFTGPACSFTYGLVGTKVVSFPMRTGYQRSTLLQFDPADAGWRRVVYISDPGLPAVPAVHFTYDDSLQLPRRMNARRDRRGDRPVSRMRPGRQVGRTW